MNEVMEEELRGPDHKDKSKKTQSGDPRGRQLYANRPPVVTIKKPASSKTDKENRPSKATFK